MLVLKLRSLSLLALITLKPGEQKTVEFTLGPEELSFYYINMNLVVEPGLFEVIVGSSSEDIRLKGTFEVA